VQAARVREVAAAAICAIVVVLTIIAFAIRMGQTLPIMSLQVAETNTNERLLTIFGGLQLFLDHPIFGAGLGAFKNQLIMGFSGPLVIHSTYVWFLAELGMVGLLTFAVPSLFILITEWRRRSPDSAGKLIVLSIVGFAIMMLPADMLYQRTFWLLIGAALASKVVSGHSGSIVNTSVS
jgi:O-antigen ligase